MTGQPQSTTTIGRDLTIMRVFDAPRELVWKAWTDPVHIARWWGPSGYTTPSCAIDLRLGGKFHYCMRGPDGPDIWVTGVYREVVAPERLVFTDCFADADGNVVPATVYGMEGVPLEMLVTVTFEAPGERSTRMTLVHAGLPQGEHIEGASVGWNESFNKLAEVLAAGD